MHAFPLANVSRHTRAFQVLMEIRNKDLSDSWTKHHPSYHNRSKPEQCFTPTCQIEITKSGILRTVKRGQLQRTVPQQGCAGLRKLQIDSNTKMNMGVESNNQDPKIYRTDIIEI